MSARKGAAATTTTTIRRASQSIYFFHITHAHARPTLLRMMCVRQEEKTPLRWPSAHSPRTKKFYVELKIKKKYIFNLFNFVKKKKVYCYITQFIERRRRRAVSLSFGQNREASRYIYVPEVALQATRERADNGANSKSPRAIVVVVVVVTQI